MVAVVLRDIMDYQCVIEAAATAGASPAPRLRPSGATSRAQHLRKLGHVSRDGFIELLTSAPLIRRDADVCVVAGGVGFVTALYTDLPYLQCTLFGTMCIDCGKMSRHGHGNNSKCLLVRQLVAVCMQRNIERCGCGTVAVQRCHHVE